MSQKLDEIKLNSKEVEILLVEMMIKNTKSQEHSTKSRMRWNVYRNGEAKIMEQDKG